MAVEIYNFFELTAVFDLKPEDAIRHFQNKGLSTSFSWLDMISEENDAAFTVAKMMDNDLLSFVEKQVEKTLNQGLTLADFKKELIPKLQKAGWWGKKDVIDPLTGQVTKAQLGSASRLENIFRTNLQSAYAVGHWQSIEDNMEHLRQLKKEKAAQLSASQQQATKVSDKAAKKARQAYMTQMAANQALKKLGQAEVDGAFQESHS